MGYEFSVLMIVCCVLRYALRGVCVCVCVRVCVRVCACVCVHVRVSMSHYRDDVEVYALLLGGGLQGVGDAQDVGEHALRGGRNGWGVPVYSSPLSRHMVVFQGSLKLCKQNFKPRKRVHSSNGFKYLKVACKRISKFTRYPPCCPPWPGAGAWSARRFRGSRCRGRGEGVAG